MLKSSNAAVAVWAAVAMAAVLVLSQAAQARQPYQAAFAEIYPALKEKIGKTKCNVCHDPSTMSKKARNEYGKALTEAMAGATKLDPVKNEADKEKFAEAVKKAGEAKAASGKTFAEIIEAGALPTTPE